MGRKPLKYNDINMPMSVMDGDVGVITKLSSKHNVEVYMLKNGEERLYCMDENDSDYNQLFPTVKVKSSLMKMLLSFTKSSFFTGEINWVCVEYKKLFGKIHIIEEQITPPAHPIIH